MSPEEIRLRCLDLAMTQARAEQNHFNIDRVVEISTRFYNHIVPGEDPLSNPAEKKAPGRLKKVDKVAPIFE